MKVMEEELEILDELNKELEDTVEMEIQKGVELENNNR